MLSREWRCSWSSADRRCANYIWVINNCIAYEGAAYVRGVTVYYTPPRWWLITVVTLSVNRGPESSLTALYCGIPIRVWPVVVVRLLCWEYTLIKLRLLVLVISTNGYNSYFNIGVVAASWILVSSRLWRSVYSIPPVIASGWQADTV